MPMRKPRSRRKISKSLLTDVFTTEELASVPQLEGSGGGGGKKGGSEAENTLQSNARLRMAELISEGPVEGLVGGKRGVYFDGTPIENEDGTLNFEGVALEERLGYPDQAHINGLPMVETPFSVETEVKIATGPVTRRILEENADAVRVIMRIPALFSYDDEGQMVPATAHYGIQVRSSGGSWIEKVSQIVENQKTVSPWQMAHRIELPMGGAPWDIRVVSYTPAPADSKTQSSIIWEGYTVVTEGKFTYPNSAYIFTEIDAKQFGSSVPSRAYRYRGLRIRVPTNYDPVARTYTGIWNGTFKTAWTNNPAWVFYDLITNDRYGLGEFVNAAKVDKWTLYNIGKYADEMIPSGYKTAEGAHIYEPRFTFNGAINTKDEAYSVLQNISSAFRGMAFWALGQTYAVADIPADPIKLVTPANVAEGQFSYSGTSKKSRHSVAIVTWNDQDDLGRPATELVINPEMLQKFGWRETRVTKHGCTSRGEAHRFGKWILDTEEHETETVRYTAGWDHAELRPFDIIAVADPAKAAVRTGGRVASVSGTQVELDAPWDTSVGGSKSISITMPDGKLEKRDIVSFASGGKVVNVSGAFSKRIDPNAVYVITSSEVNPRQYRVLTVQETENGQFEVMALFHDPTKYARVEQGIHLDDISYSRPGHIVPAPTNLNVEEFQYVENSIPYSKIQFSFTPDQLASSNSVVVSGPRGVEEFTNVTVPSIEIRDVVPGEYTFTVRSYSAKNIPSPAAVLVYDAHGWSGGDLLSVVDLSTVEGGAIFTSTNAILTWRNVIPEGADLYKDNQVTIFDRDTNEILRQEFVVGTTFNYSYEKNTADGAYRGRGPYRSFRVEVVVRDKTGRESNPSSLVVANPPPATPVPQYENGYGQVFMFWQNPKETDFAGTLVWIGDTDDFVPVWNAADVLEPGQYKMPSYDTMASEVSIPLFVDRWIRIGSYDTFGKDGMSISEPVKVSPLNFVVDTEAPDKPTGLLVQSKLNDAGKAVVDVTWDANTEEDLAQYDLEIAFWEGNFMSIPTGSNFYTFECDPGTMLRVRLRARDVSSNGSHFTEEVTHIAAADTIPPEAPVNVQARASFKSMWLSWDPNTEADLLRYEVFVNEDGVAPAADLPVQMPKFPSAAEAESEEEETEPEVAPQFYVTSNAFAYTGLDSGIRRYFWVRAVDTSFNASEWSLRVDAQTIQLDPLDVNIELEGMAMPVDELPDPITETTPLKVFLRSDNRIYFQLQGEWVYEKDSRLLEGQLLGSQIGDNEITDTLIDNLSISTPKLRSNSVDARKLRANAIEAHHIAANAIRAGHIAADTIGADEIAADAVTAKHIGAEVIIGEMIKGETIKGTHLEAQNIITAGAQIGEALIDDAHIVELDAAKIRAGSILSGEVVVDGKGDIAAIADGAALGAQDPATRINSGTTRILPGQIEISGTTKLSDWIKGGDVTRIDGGMISANTIMANALVIGMRNLTVSNVEFDHTGNTLTWTSGTISYVNDDGTKTTQNVSSGNAAFSSATVYIYWTKGASTLSATTAIATAFADSNAVIATYNGGANINADYGRTIIDGAKIKTGTVIADQVRANAIEAANIQAGAVRATHILAAQIETDHLKVGGVTTDRLAISSASVVAGNTNYAGVGLTSSWQHITQASITIPAGIQGASIWVSGASSITMAAGIAGIEMRLLVNGSQYWMSHGGNNGQAVMINPSGCFAVGVAPGTFTASLELRSISGPTPYHAMSSISIVGAKR